MPDHVFSGYVLALASLLHFIRLTRWQGWRTVAQPLVLILHIGYAWLAIGIGLLGLSILAPQVLAASAALHAITAGAMGVMTLAMMTRATRGHTGRTLRADVSTIAIYALVNLGAFLRVVAPYLPLKYTNVLLIASLIWGSAFVLFAIVYGRYLLTRKLARH